jgi:hypothetical protein
MYELTGDAYNPSAGFPSVAIGARSPPASLAAPRHRPTNEFGGALRWPAPQVTATSSRAPPDGHVACAVGGRERHAGSTTTDVWPKRPALSRELIAHDRFDRNGVVNLTGTRISRPPVA